ncbi:TetR/AcrR family transcriptional regulator [Actinomadura rupiterrae]|uniref:TetR/AcrR family transcriptional regulator n=1 Tax=Actinomadura rupiterrae TaxID=559627 RepID=UPI0020A26558|nr:TetR/AcrR family transcriptional regulator [Actinomadura rupiterrae]MCP2340687.1 AcrR family transcriptional regulator [Actinomadura rupiterrae]
MAEKSSETPRERYRVQIRAEVKRRAWEQIASAGASALSLNAIAKQMGMSGPALYRYFANRDELITELIRDAYQSLADTVQAATTLSADLGVVAHALRRWALEDPQRYFLIYGTPVPGYQAPDDTTVIADEIMSVLLKACAKSIPERPATPLDKHLEDHRQWADASYPPSVLHRALTFWTRCHGVLSLELAGHFTGMGLDPAKLFEAELDDLLTP